MNKIWLENSEDWSVEVNDDVSICFEGKKLPELTFSPQVKNKRPRLQLGLTKAQAREIYELLFVYLGLESLELQ